MVLRDASASKNQWLSFTPDYVCLYLRCTCTFVLACTKAHRLLYYLHIGPVEDGASGSELVKVGCVDFWRAVNCLYFNVDFFLLRKCESDFSVLDNGRRMIFGAPPKRGSWQVGVQVWPKIVRNDQKHILSLNWSSAQFCAFAI